jgi:hypothetical protein
MDHATSAEPIYRQLIEDKGDVPAGVRAAWDEVRRQLAPHIRVDAERRGAAGDWFS